MHRARTLLRFAPVLAGLLLTGSAFAQDFSGVADQVNKKMVKLFGAGGFKGVASYGTGVIVSPKGHVLTVASVMLDSQNLRAHLADGRRFDNVKVIVMEPELDLAMVKIEGVDDLPYFDIADAAKKPLLQNGDWVLAFSNQLQIATRDEPMSIQRGVIATYAKLHGRRGIFDAPYTGDVYVIDAITNNPGAAGGALTTRKGDLVGLIGKELRNTLTDTWLNYAVPIQARLDVQQADKKVSLSLAEFVDKAIRGEYKPVIREKLTGGPRGYHGIVLVPDVRERTPPFIDEVMSKSPASKAGLKPDDLVVYVDGEHVISVKAFNDLMTRARPGTKVVLEVRRGDKLKTIDLTLAEPLTKK